MLLGLDSAARSVGSCRTQRMAPRVPMPAWVAVPCGCTARNRQRAFVGQQSLWVTHPAKRNAPVRLTAWDSDWLELRLAKGSNRVWVTMSQFPRPRGRGSGPAEASSAAGRSRIAGDGPDAGGAPSVSSGSAPGPAFRIGRRGCARAARSAKSDFGWAGSPDAATD